MKRTVAALAASLFALAAGPARADDLATIQTAMKAASANVHSFRIEVTSPMGMSAVMTVVREPARVHMQFTGLMNVETYTTDGFLYMRLGTAGWKKYATPIPAIKTDVVRSLSEAEHMTVGPDVTENGAVYGSLLVKTDANMLPGVPTPTAALTCTYDKRTYLMRACTGDAFSETITGYDDPANAVALPPDAANAPDGGPLPFALPTPTTAPK